MIIYALVNSRDDEKCFVTCALYEIELRKMLREVESGSDTILKSLRNYLKDAKPRHYTEDENFVVRLRVPTRFFVYKIEDFFLTYFPIYLTFQTRECV